MSYRKLSTAQRITSFECALSEFVVLWIKLRIRKRHVLVCRVYRPPDTSAEKTKELLNGVCECYRDPRYACAEFVLLGDPNIDLHGVSHFALLRGILCDMNFTD